MYTLTAEQELDLVAAAREGDRDAWATLIEKCQGYARKLAADAAGQPADVDDLTQVALVNGLGDAIDTWDPERSPFRKWVWTKMQGAVMDEVRRRGRAPVAEDDSVLADEPSTDPQPDELCLAGLCDLAVRDAVAEAAEDEREVAIAGARLLAEEPMGLTELGALLGLTPQRVGQIEAELVDRVRDALEDDDGQEA